MKQVKSIIYNYLDIIIFSLSMIIKLSVMSYFLQKNYTGYHSFYPSVVGSILIIISFGILFKGRRRLRFFYISNILVSSLIISDIVYYRYFKDLISIFVLVNSLQLGAVTSSVTGLIKPTDFLLFIDIIPLFFLKKLYKSDVPNIKIKKLKPIVFAVLMTVAVITEWTNFSHLSKAQPQLLTNMYNKSYISKSLGNINYHFVDTYNYLTSFISRRVPLSGEKEKAVYTYLDRNKNEASNYNASYKGKNLIMIQVEALQGFTINNKVNGQEITPNLNKFINKSMYFNNIYYQVATGGTSDAEFMTNNSLYPASSGSAYFLYAGNKFNSLGSRLKKSGYNAEVLHGYRESFWNRNVMYKAESFDHFYGEKSFNIDEKIGLGLSDKSFLNQSVKRLQSFKEPYYSFLITLSSHYPFDDVKHYGDFNTGNLENTFLGNYLKAAHYADEQLGMFLNSLDREGILKNSVVVIYGDHNAITRSNEGPLLNFLGIKDTELNWNLQQKIPLIIHVPDEKLTGTNDILGGQMDVMPTILNLLGVSSKGTLGYDLLNCKSPYVIFRNGSFIDKDYFYLSQLDAYYDLKTNSAVKDSSLLDKRKNNYIKELQYSDDILKHNLIKK